MTSSSTRSESDVLTPVISEIDAYLASVLNARELPEILRGAISYATLYGGKRLRPALVLLACEAVGGDRADALPPAAAIELIHNFSLVHDDLPSMDDDALRRGRPTLHVQAGEAMATLAGDAMVSIAFELIAEASLDADVRSRIVRELASATTAMITGQVHDTVGGFPDGLSDEQRLGAIHRNKTGALLRAACRMGAICGHADEKVLGRLDRYGEAIGVMFQIVDDLLDVTQSTEHLGKAAGKDLSAGKLTWPGVMGIERSKDDVRALQAEARDALAPLGDAAEPLRRLGDHLAVRTR
ncbi:MAG: polyprenyl synthetase family protein [Planctomycetes bacterium]|nr:polyprenyl synthetase family protein [Planctomycetota bacterium]